MTRPDQRQEILSTQRARLKTEELRNEFDYVSRACDPDADNRTRLFNALLERDNRKQEPWAIQTLELLSADIYEPQNNNLISPSLKSLKYLQDTSDIFFSTKWLKALLGHHKSEAAKMEVENFLKANPDYPENLRNKILEAAWILTAQKPYVEKAKPTIVNAKKRK